MHSPGLAVKVGDDEGLLKLELLLSFSQVAYARAYH
jgi:hypothetical protein